MSNVLNVLPTLWAHQLAAIAAVELAMAAGRDCGLVVLPTGTGKTGMVLSLGRRLGVPMLFLVNRDELMTQTLRAAARFWPEAHAAAIQAGGDLWDVPTLGCARPPDLVVAMVPTLVNRLGTISTDRFALVVADEAHMSVAPTWQKVLGHFRPGFRLGVTATPQRLDGKGLCGLYGREPLYSYSLHQAIKDGRLVDVDARECQTSTSLDDLATDEGEGGEQDFRRGQLAQRVNNSNRNDLIVATYLRDARQPGSPFRRRAVAFCVDVGHAENLAAAFVGSGVRAVAVTGKQKPEQRRRIIADFAAGLYDVVTNCEVLTTGYDDPGISCLLMCRPTESRSLYVQMVGRGLRLYPGKTSCLVIDFTDNCKKHKLVSVLDLLGKKKPLSNGGSTHASPAQREPGKQLELPLQSLVSWTLSSVCPWPELPSLDGYIPSLDWHNDPASEGQFRMLARFGLMPSEALSKGEAGYLIDRAMEYEAAFPIPATEKQARFLRQHNLWAEGMGKRQASLLIADIKEKLRRIANEYSQIPDQPTEQHA